LTPKYIDYEEQLINEYCKTISDINKKKLA